MRVEGYLWAATPLWMWQDEIAEQLVEIQEYWLARGFLRATADDQPHYGVICQDYRQLARLIIVFAPSGNHDGHGQIGMIV